LRGFTEYSSQKQHSDLIFVSHSWFSVIDPSVIGIVSSIHCCSHTTPCCVHDDKFSAKKGDKKSCVTYNKWATVLPLCYHLAPTIQTNLYFHYTPVNKWEHQLFEHYSQRYTNPKCLMAWVTKFVLFHLIFSACSPVSDHKGPWGVEV
jgi:hypothetical protein